MSDVPPRLFVATPTADGIALAPYVASLAATISHLAERGITTVYRTLDGTDLVRQRNLLVDAFLRSGCTHLLFIDSDMVFAPDLAERLLRFRKRLIGAVYSKRFLDLARLKELCRSQTFERALPLAYDWNLVPLDGQVVVQGGICQVAALPGGFLLIERECLEEMSARLSVPDMVAETGQGSVKAFFRETWGPDRGVVDLDYSFCDFWRAADGEVWAYPAAEIRHVGDTVANLPFRALLEGSRIAAAARRPPQVGDGACVPETLRP